MNPGTSQPKKKCCNPEVYAYGLAILGVFLIVGGLVYLMYYFTRPEPLGAGRAKERREALQVLRAENESVLNNYAWQDASKGIVRLPIADAMKLMESKWSKDPVMARSNLIERVEKANFVPPPKPSQFE